MNFQFEQLVTVSLFIVACFAFYKIKIIYVRVFIVAIIMSMIFFNPLKFKQEGMSKIESVNLEYSVELPAKVIVKELSFDEKQKQQMNELKQQTKEIIKNEIN